MNILIEKNISIPMRDGVYLATDVYRLADGGPYPTLIMRSPYNKEAPGALSGNFDVLRAVQAGYVVVAQDCRGRFASAGEFDPHFQEVNDGVDCAIWAANQAWSNGKLGTFGSSYLGATQWLAAPAFPTNVLAMSPTVTPGNYYADLGYRGGALQIGSMLFWNTMIAIGEQQRRVQRGQATPADVAQSALMLDNLAALYQTTPLLEMAHLQGIAPHFFDWLTHNTYDDYWRSIAPQERYEQVKIPALHIGGWYDLFLNGTLTNFQGMKARGGSLLARQQQKLIIGPWSHGNFSGFFPELEFGMAASADAVDLTGKQLRWFDRWLNGNENGIEQEPPVRIFVMGANVWRDEADWPLPDTHYRAYYLHSNGQANTLHGDGLLSTEQPGNEAPDHYQADPHNPVPTLGGANLMPGGNVAGPRDQRPVETRNDVLCYTTAPLVHPVEVTGPVELVLYVSSSAPDTDFHAKLIDVHPDGRAMLLTDGIVRARYRESLTALQLLVPGQVYELRIDLWATANLFLVGHCLRLEIASSNFPRYDRNSNTGGVIAAEHADQFVVATNYVYHDDGHPSHLILPIIERS